MATQQERAELHKTIWKIANELRGSVDGWEFKAYVLGSIFYRFISENICDYIQGLMKDAGQPDFDYTAIHINDERYAPAGVLAPKSAADLAFTMHNGNKNILQPEHQDKIMELFQNRKDEQYLAKLVKNDDILANDCNLSVRSYVEQEDTREVIDITEVNAKLKDLISEGNELNAKIEAIVKELGE
mgnify:CR=1 FL=1